MIPYRTARAPLNPPSPRWGEGVKRSASLMTRTIESGRYVLTLARVKGKKNQNAPGKAPPSITRFWPVM
jgi:hypothetical protein